MKYNIHHWLWLLVTKGPIQKTCQTCYIQKCGMGQNKLIYCFVIFNLWDHYVLIQQKCIGCGNFKNTCTTQFGWHLFLSPKCLQFLSFRQKALFGCLKSEKTTWTVKIEMIWLWYLFSLISCPSSFKYGDLNFNIVKWARLWKVKLPL